jgi:hypothetical protein
MIILVISMHAADTYSPFGNWYYVERPPLGPAALLTFAVWQTYLQSFFMGLLFFVAGVFTPGSFDRKGGAQFLRDRAFRLGLPVLFYMVVLGPVTEYYVAGSWTGPASFAHEWWRHIRNGEVLQENGPLWFCLALLIFSIAYAAIESPRTQPRQAGRHRGPPATRELVGFALAMAAGRFLIRLAFPNAVVMNMHLGDFAQYVLLFAAGILASRYAWLDSMPTPLAKHWAAAVLPASLALWLFVLAASGVFHGGRNVPDTGWHWQSAALSVWESFTCVAVSLGLLTVFRDRFDAQGTAARFLSANAFSVYVFHPPIVIIGARLLHSAPLLPLVKFALLTATATIVTYALSAAVFRRTPMLRAIL